ncbi:phospholipid-translocating P-type ATPase-like protein [Aulographum hederae CBS 113979]|uniref:Phospholipid-transporting ATPase n=1 Tax=Aulographum hederae CBS 113979 TaxID=1176131 RepID=A0A6G1GIQ0_9PEZI|nr:phospholipid-translocating P-type ATPase-like protein [Aulographum hederae CBS 113979]
MSTPHHYHQPNAPDPHDEDSESDLELDLHELDPTTSSHTSGPSKRNSKDTRRPLQDYAGRIPLRNLRVGRLRGNRGLRSSSRGHDAEEEDLRGLLQDDNENKRDSGGSAGTGDDDAPLLSTRNGKRKPKEPEGRLVQWANMLGLAKILRLPPSEPEQELPDDDEVEEHDPSSNRTVLVSQRQPTRFPPNAVSNAKYTPLSFLPRTLYNEFSFFFNLYFLLVALSQIIPALRIGYLITYIAPLAFVLSITLGKEAYDDIQRRRRDTEANSEGYTVLRFDDGSENLSSSKKRKAAKRKSKKSKNASSRLTDVEDEEASAEGGANDKQGVSYEEISKRSSDLKVGDVLMLEKNQRVPADVIILKTVSSDAAPSAPIVPEAVEPEADLLVGASSATSSTAPNSGNVASNEREESSEAFIRTDQLDGETDWKLRLPSPLTQALKIGQLQRLNIVAGKPDKKVNEFVGTLELKPPPTNSSYDPHISSGAPVEDSAGESQSKSAPLSIDNTAWANTIMASTCTVYAVIVYTGAQTRQALSTSPSRSKTGLLEHEINSLTKILCALTLTLSFILVALEGFEPEPGRKWYVSVMRFLILFSTIVPVSLRVNLDMGKTVYAWFIQHDDTIPETVVRTSTIPEDLGRIEYLLSDKTGTLTQNEMEMKKIHVGTVSYANEAMDEVASYVRQAFVSQDANEVHLVTPSTYVAPAASATRTRREIGSRVRDVVLALALCHNVTPTTEEVNGETVTAYQASSPDEIAIVRWTEQVGLRLLQRDRTGMVLQSTETGKVVVRVRILSVFPFTSEGKRMGIVVQFDAGNGPQDENSEVWFYQKGADTVMTSIVAANDWLDEETANMAREGLRTLVVGRKKLSSQQYSDFSAKYAQASLALHHRDSAMAEVVKQFLERDLELLGVTGVEDKLQKDVKPSLELLRNAGIKIWMLTGDKVETARCVAISSKLVARGQYVHTIAKLKRKDLAHDSLSFLQTNPTACLLIDGESLALMLLHHREAFISTAVRLPTVVACRCSPTQKADVARLIRAHTHKRICCIGDGGNDVSMIQAADVGVGIVGKEGRQASLAADFSVTQFCHLTRLLVWHGRNSYKRSAKLAQFVIHRGLIISVCQAMFSIASDFEPNALYKDWLLVGYATLYTMMPVFSLVLDTDIPPALSHLYPELYRDLRTGRSLSYRSFFIWVAVSVYQGCLIQGLSQLLIPSFESDAGFKKMVAVSYTVLITNELLMVAAEVTTWHWIMATAIVGTAAIYAGSVPFLGRYFDLGFVASSGFWWRGGIIVAVAVVPPYVVKILGRVWRPPSYRKVQGL